MIGLMRRLRREDEGFALVIVMLLLAIMMVLLVVALNAGNAALREADFGVKWSRTLALAESGVNDAIITLGQDRSATSSCPMGGLVACAGDGGEYQVDWTTDLDGSLTITAQASYPSVNEAKYTRTVQVLLEPVPSFQYALFAYDDLEVKNNDVVEGSIYSTGSILLNQNSIVCGSVVSASGALTLGSNAKVVQDYVPTGCSGEDGDLWIGGWIRASLGVVVEGDVKASAPSGTACSAVSTSYEITGGTIEGDATACGRITSTVLGLKSAGTSTSPAAVETIPTFTFLEANYPSITCYGGPGECAETNTSATAVTDFQTFYDANSASMSGIYAVWQESPSITDAIVLAPLTLSGDLTIITNAPIDFGNTTSVTTVGGVPAELVIVSLYVPPAATSCSVNGGDCSIFAQNQLTFDQGLVTDTSDGIAVLFYTTGKLAFKNSGGTSSIGDGALYAGAMDLKNGFKIRYNSRIASVLGFGSGLTVTLWQELSD